MFFQVFYTTMSPLWSQALQIIFFYIFLFWKSSKSSVFYSFQSSYNGVLFCPDLSNIFHVARDLIVEILLLIILSSILILSSKLIIIVLNFYVQTSHIFFEHKTLFLGVLIQLLVHKWHCKLRFLIFSISPPVGVHVLSRWRNAACLYWIRKRI